MANFVFASDENYVAILSVAIISLLENNYDVFDEINIYILDNNITKNSKEKILKQTTKYGKVNISFISLNLEKYLNSEYYGKLPISACSRLFMSEVLPKMDKIIYLDCDILILDSLKELWDTNIEKYYCGGVLEGVSSYLRESNGLKNNDYYINSGILLINLKKWRHEHIISKFIEKINERNYFDTDQAIINIIFNKYILILNPIYNLTSSFHYNKFDGILKVAGAGKGKFYSKEEITAAQNNPIILHFTDLAINRPWLNQKHHYFELYDNYAKLSLFYDKMYVSEKNSIKDKMYLLIFIKYASVISKIIPSKIFEIKAKNALKKYI